jgi:hypothetical protein
MSGLIAFIPLIFEAVSATVATVGTIAASIGTAVFTGVSALTAGIGLSGTLGTIITGALSSGVTGGLLGGVGSLITGGDFLDGVKNGAIAGAISGGVLSGIGTMGGATSTIQAPDIAGEVNIGPINPGVPNLQPTGIGDVASAASAAPGGSTFTGFNPSGAAPAIGASGPGASDISRLGAATTSAATTGNEGTFFGKDGLFNNQTVGGLLEGLGKNLAGDNPGAIADTQNAGAMDRQNDQQQYYSDNYNIRNGMLPGSPQGAGAGRPTPAQAFGAARAGTGTGEWEWYYDKDKHALARRAVGAT